MKRSIIAGCYLVLIFLGAAFAAYVSADSPKVVVGGDTYEVVIADTPAEQERGLSGRKFIPKGTAMLFAFDVAEQQCFWMKDMRFPIDMVWVGPSKRITHVERNVSPNTYPRQFCPEVPAQYVIETNANATQNARVGDVVHIQY